MRKYLSVILCLSIILSIIPMGDYSAAGTAKKRPSYLFAIDAGHGGNDSGSIGADKRHEANDNKKVADEVIKLLKEQGQRTYLINRNLVTHDRPLEANSVNADFLISLHRDYASSSSPRGINVYTHEPSHYQRKQQPEKDYAPAEYANKHAVDDKLVNNLKSYLTGATGIPFREIHYGSANAPIWEDFYINRLSNMPSCIIELGFCSSPEDNKIFDSSYKTLALAIVKALLATVGLDYIGPFSGSGAMICSFKGEWYYVVNGVVAWDYTGTVVYGGKTYHVENGYVIDIAAGKTGGCDWQLDGSVLTVTGNGAMANYTASSELPWGTSITTVNIENGVTGIGAFSFNKCSAISEIKIAKSVKSIGNSALNACSSLSKVYYYGTKEEWNSISIGTNNLKLYEAEIYFICDINGHKYDFACSSACNVCKETRDVTHTYSSICDVSCDVCGEIRVTTHTYSGVCDRFCDICKYKREVDAEHIFDENEICIVCGSPKTIPGDLNDDEDVTDADAVHLLMHTFFPEDYPVNQNCDYNGDGEINDADAVHLLMYTFFPEDYPI